MSFILISAVTLAYAGVAISEFWKGNYPMMFVFVGYAMANVGLIAAMESVAK